MEEFITEVNIIDSIMGSGKSHTMLNYMVENKDKEKFVYITPYLNEVDRVLAHEGLEISRPIGTVARERERAIELGLDLELIRGTNVPKHSQIRSMIEDGKNVVSTHETLKNMCCCSNLGEYTLILDEVLKLVDIYDIKIKTVESFEKEGYIIVDEITGKILPTERGMELWGGTEENLTRFLDYAKKGLLYKAIKKVIITEYPIELISQFKKVYVLTYIFNGSYLKSFLDMHNMKYNLKTISFNNEVVDWDIAIHKQQIAPYRELFNLHNPKVSRGNYNEEIRDSIGRLGSCSSHKLPKDKCVLLNNIIRRYAMNCGARKNEFLYTVFKEVYNRAGKSIKGYSNSFLAYNTRATNEYRQANTIAYCVSRYTNPVIANYMRDKAKELGSLVVFDDDELALGDMLQFIFRGCIRDKKPMNLLIGDDRMRGIFITWLYK